MSDVTSVRHIATTADATGSDPLSVTRNYTSTYTVTVRDQNIGPLEILSHFKNDPELPWHGRTYKSNSGVRDNASLCNRMSVPTRIRGSYNLWTLETGFEDQAGGGEGSQGELQVSVNGQKTKDPLKWHDDIEVGFSQINVPSEVPTFRGFENPGINNPFLPVGRIGAYVNSALTPFSPKPEMELDIKIIRISRNVPEWNDDLANQYQGTVNNAHATIIKPGYGFTAQIGPYSGRIKAISGQFRYENDIKYWRISIEVHINPLGWRRRILDAGLDRLVAAGLPDGHGGTYSASDVPADGLPHTKQLTDQTGEPIRDIVSFNGQGFPKKKEEKDVIMVYSDYEEKSWGDIPW